MAAPEADLNAVSTALTALVALTAPEAGAAALAAPEAGAADPEAGDADSFSKKLQAFWGKKLYKRKGWGAAFEEAEINNFDLFYKSLKAFV